MAVADVCAHRRCVCQCAIVSVSALRSLVYVYVLMCVSLCIRVCVCQNSWIVCVFQGVEIV